MRLSQDGAPSGAQTHPGRATYFDTTHFCFASSASAASASSRCQESVTQTPSLRAPQPERTIQ
eukprot:COSAG04_NODE_20628_length_389_cov_1.237931_1_plen_62_part_01